MTRCLGPLSLCQLRLIVVAESPILMTQKLSLNECILCFRTICQPICLSSVICLETNGEKKQNFTLAWRKMTCANIVQISVTQRFITKTIFWTFFSPSAFIITLTHFSSLWLVSCRRTIIARFKIFQNISIFKIVISCYSMLLLQNPDIINSPQMLHYMCAPHSTPSCGLRMNGDRAHHQHLQITSDKKYYDEQWRQEMHN